MDLFEQPAGSPAKGGSPKQVSPRGAVDPMSFMSDDSATKVGVMDAFAGMEPTSLQDVVPMVLDEKASQRIKEWEKEQEEKAHKLEQAELQSKKKKRESAQKELNEFYASRTQRIQAKKKTNRAQEKDWLAQQAESGQGKNPWERVLNMIPDVPIKPDATPYQDTTRFKQVLLHLKTTSVPN